MRLLGQGRACGGISLLHAVGCGNGCAAPIDLWTHVSLTDESLDISEDEHKLLERLIDAWKARDLPLPDGNLGWKINSNIPIGMGLKSSSALLVAARDALSQATGVMISDAVCCNILSAIQIQSGCSITGGRDDIVVCNNHSTILVDVYDEVACRIKRIKMPPMEVFLIIRDLEKSKINIAEFENRKTRFEEIVIDLVSGNPLQAFSKNGQLVGEATGDKDALAICEDIEILTNGRAAISGSGPAIAVICPREENQKIIEHLKSRGLQFIHTRIYQYPELTWEREPWE